MCQNVAEALLETLAAKHARADPSAGAKPEAALEPAVGSSGSGAETLADSLCAAARTLLASRLVDVHRPEHEDGRLFSSQVTPESNSAFCQSQKDLHE